MVHHEQAMPHGNAAPERRETLRYHLNAGIARFIASAQADHAIGRQFFNPNPVFSPSEIADAVSSASYRQVDFSPINTISNFQREKAWENYANAGVSVGEQQDQWIQSMVTYFRNYFQYAPDEITQLLQGRLGVDVKADDSTLRTNVSQLWEKYLGEGSKIEQFFQDLTADLTNVGPAEAAEVIKRVQVVTPLLGMFGNTETLILAHDAALAVAAMELMPKDTLLQEVQTNFQQFADRNQWNAYVLLWSSLRQKIAQQQNPPEDNHENEGPAPQQPPRRTPPPDNPPGGGQAAAQPQPEPVPHDAAQQPPSQEHERPQPAERVHAPAHQEAEEDAAQAQRQHVPHEPDVAEEVHEQERLEESYTVPEHLILEERVGKAGTFEYATFNMKDPEHPDFGADRTLALPIAGGESMLFAAIDGIGEGGRYSTFAAETVRDELARIPAILQKQPSEIEAQQTILTALKKAAARIEALKNTLQSDGVKDTIRDTVGAVASVGIVCKDNQGHDRLLTINLGDCRIYMFDPASGVKPQPVTHDHSLPQILLRQGQLTEDQAFLHKQRRGVTQTVSPKHVEELERKIQLGESISDYIESNPLPKTSIAFLAVTDGWTDNTPPDLEQLDIEESWRESTNGTRKKKTVDIRRFVRSLGDRVYRRFYASRHGTDNQKPLYRGRNTEDEGKKEYVKLDDVGIVAVYRKGS